VVACSCLFLTYDILHVYSGKEISANRKFEDKWGNNCFSGLGCRLHAVVGHGNLFHVLVKLLVVSAFLMYNVNCKMYVAFSFIYFLVLSSSNTAWNRSSELQSSGSGHFYQKQLSNFRITWRCDDASATVAENSLCNSKFKYTWMSVVPCNFSFLFAL